MKRKPYLVVDLLDCVLTFSSGKFNWTADIFFSMRTLCSEGLYALALYVPGDLDPQNLEYIERTLNNERIFIDKIISKGCELNDESIDLSLSYLIAKETRTDISGVEPVVFTDWNSIVSRFSHTKGKGRSAKIERITRETKISVSLDLDGTGISSVSTKIPFFDHMLDQIAKHGHIDLSVDCDGDIEVDEHHSVEDVAITLGQALMEALGDKRGISRYGSATIPMDDVCSTVAVDFSNRPYFVWDVTFSRDMVGTFPTEMVYHFFKSLCDESRCNLHMSVTQGNTHHQVEALFKGYARAVREAVFIYPGNTQLPSTKGVL